MKKWESAIDIYNHSKLAVNKQIKELVTEESVEIYNEKPNNKGWIGQSIEKDWFELPNNSSKYADFKNVGVELKVTPIKKVRDTWSSKERLVLNIFNFHEEFKNDFNKASFLSKGDLIQVIYYEHIDGVPSPELEIKQSYFLSIRDLPKEDLLIIENDWDIIVDKIKQGKAEELSDSLTRYLGATTKGAKTDKNMTTQPFSEEKAHRRSFTLKTTYMSHLTRQIMHGNYIEEMRVQKNGESVPVVIPMQSGLEKIVKNSVELETLDFDAIVLEELSKYIGCTKTDLANKFGVEIPKTNDKATTAIIAGKMLNLEGDIDKSEEFVKSGTNHRIIVVKDSNFNKSGLKGKTKESFKLVSPINLTDEFLEDWENSRLREYLLETRFLLFVFAERQNDLVFLGAKFWSVPAAEINGLIRTVWEETKESYNSGIELNYVEWNSKKGYRVENNFPKISDDRIVHVRPDAGKSSYKKNKNSLRLPVPAKWNNRPEFMVEELSDHYMTKQAFWFNPSYMFSQIKSIIEDFKKQ